MTVPTRHQRGNHTLPLFLWADRIEHERLPYAARRLLHRFHLEPTRARLLAELAGFQLEARE